MHLDAVVAKLIDQDFEVPVNWKPGLPKKPGIYWLYSYRYGKGNHADGTKIRQELHLLEVHKIANGVMHVADGQFVYKSEVEEPYYTDAILPMIPMIIPECPHECVDCDGLMGGQPCGW